MEREGSSHPLDEMFNDDAHEQKDNQVKKNEKKVEQDSKQEFKSKLLSLRLLKETKPLIRKWETVNLKRGAIVEHISTPAEAMSFLNWARTEKGLNIQDNPKLYEIFNFMRDELPLPEKSQIEPPEAEMVLEKEESVSFHNELTRDTSESDSLLASIEKDHEIKNLFNQWKEETEDVIGETISKDDVINFLDWATKEKTLEISGKLYKKLDHFRYDLEHGNSGEIAEEEQKIIVDPKVYEEAEKIEATKKRISDLPTESDILGSEAKSEKLRSHRQQIQDLYGVTLDEEGQPATPKDEAKIAKMLGLIDADVQKVQRSGFFGKVKGFFQNMGVSEKDKMIAYGFKKDLGEYTHFMLENVQPKYESRGPVSRSMIRERGSVGTSVGTIETARHSPIKRTAPKRGRPRKAKV